MVFAATALTMVLLPDLVHASNDEADTRRVEDRSRGGSESALRMAQAVPGNSGGDDLAGGSADAGEDATNENDINDESGATPEQRLWRTLASVVGAIVLVIVMQRRRKGRKRST